MFGSLVLNAQIPASSPEITYIGRTLVQQEAVSFDWSGTMVHIRFKGSRLEAVCSDSGRNYYNVWVDKTPCPVHDNVVVTEGDRQTIVIAEGLQKKKVHDIYLQKRSEGEQGITTLHSFSTDGSFLQAEDEIVRRIEFIGDSYTCGYGTEAADRDQPFRPAEENCNLTYAAILGRYFGAAVTHISHSGRGIVRNYDSAGGLTMPQRYPNTFDSRDDVKWDPSSVQAPDIVVIYLGTNDFSTGKQPTLSSWCDNYKILIECVKEAYGKDVPVLCLASKADENMAEYVRQAALRCGQPAVYHAAVLDAAINNTSDLGASWHPNYAGHRKVASIVAPYISTITGWEMPFKTIE